MEPWELWSYIALEFTKLLELWERQSYETHGIYGAMRVTGAIGTMGAMKLCGSHGSYGGRGTNWSMGVMGLWELQIYRVRVVTGAIGTFRAMIVTRAIGTFRAMELQRYVSHAPMTMGAMKLCGSHGSYGGCGTNWSKVVTRAIGTFRAMGAIEL